MAKNEISRRTFIKGLAAGAASVATLGVLQGIEYSIQNKPSSGGTTAPPGEQYDLHPRHLFRLRPGHQQ